MKEGISGINLGNPGMKSMRMVVRVLELRKKKTSVDVWELEPSHVGGEEKGNRMYDSRRLLFSVLTNITTLSTRLNPVTLSNIQEFLPNF